MKAHVLTGAKREIADRVASFEGEIREVIVFVEDSPPEPALAEEDIFAEMEPFMAQAGGADCSRESLYTRQPGE